MYRPLYNHVLIRPLPAEEQKAGDIILANPQPRSHEAEVKAVGPGRDKPLPLKVGERVVYTQGINYPVVVDGVPCLLMDIAQIIAVREDT